MADGFILNFENQYQIDITPDSETPTWKDLAAGIKSMTWDGNEVVDQTVYMDGEGVGSSDVTGGQPVCSVSGDRKIGDDAQDYIMGLQFSYGEARKTKLKWTSPDESVMTCDITIANIKDSGGDANAKDAISFELHMNGMPDFS